jgi:hypothetical protein
MFPTSLRSSIYQVLGPGSLSGQLFADLCDQLLLNEAAARGYQFRCPSDRTGDFKGLDAYSQPGMSNFEGIAGKVGFQYKFFPTESSPLTAGHKADIRKSLLSASKENADLDTWILITPEDFNRHQELWFVGLRSEVSFNIAHWGQKELARLLTRFPEAAMHIYPELVPGFRPPTFKEMCQSLARRFAQVPHHSLYHMDIRLSDNSSSDFQLQKFIEDNSLTLFCLLGGYGTGKSTALEHLALSLAAKFLNDPSSRIPLLIRIRHLRGSGALRDNLIRYLETEYGLKMNITTLQSLNASGRTVLLFDGLDEGEGSSQNQRGKGILSEIYEFLSPAGKLLISSRTEFFNSVVEERTKLFGLQRPHILKISGDTVQSLDHRGVITYVSLLSPEEIDTYIKRRMGTEAPPLLSRLKSIYDLRDIVRRPVLLNMVCDTLPYFESETGEILAADLYQRYIVEHLSKDIEAGRIKGSLERRMIEIAALAEHMLVNKKVRMRHIEITREILHTDDEADAFLSSAFLLRDPSGIYEFSHNSFLEYFGALRMFGDIQNSNLSSLIWEHLSSYTKEQLEFLNQIVETNWRAVNGEHENQVEGHLLSNGLLGDREPVTMQRFQGFLDATGYKVLCPIENTLGYAAVSWFDAISFAIWSKARLMRGPEFISLINSEFPDPPRYFDWVCRVSSADSIVFLRHKREWAWPVIQVGSTWMESSRADRVFTFSKVRRGLPLSVFRCVRGIAK